MLSTKQASRQDTQYVAKSQLQMATHQQTYEVCDHEVKKQKKCYALDDSPSHSQQMRLTNVIVTETNSILSGSLALRVDSHSFPYVIMVFF